MGQLRRDDLDRLFDFNIHVPTRILFMGSEVDEDGEMAEFFLKGMAMLEAVNRDPITVIMNNMGGDDYHGLAIFDAIATSDCHIIVKAYGYAMSMGSWIFQAADERIISPRATMMLHYGNAHIESPGQQREWDRLLHMMENTYLKRIRKAKPRFSMAQLRTKMEIDWYLSAEDAVSYGLADRMLTE